MRWPFNLVRIAIICQMFGYHVTAHTQEVLTFRDFMRDVTVHHPLTQIAELELAVGDGKLLAARGEFDPKLGFGIDAKRFKDQTYYELLDAGVKVATPWGVEFGTGFERNRGDFLNDQNSLPDEGLWNLQVKVPLGQGLFFDQRRAILQKAQLAQQASEEKRRLMINKVLSDAGKAYWNWFESYHALDVYREAMRLAEVRLAQVTQSAIIGELAQIDTVEASIQFRARTLSVQEAELQYEIDRNNLSLYLWVNGEIPLQLAVNTVPLAQSDLTFDDIGTVPQLDSLVATHPELRGLSLEVEQMGVETRLRREYLKPVVDLTYKPLASTVAELAAVNRGDYTLGVQFGIPLFLRKERGKLAIAKAEMEQAELDYQYISAAVHRESLNAYESSINLVEQISTARDLAFFYRRLLQGEQELFNNGESSLFLINARETGLISYDLKLISLYAKYKKAEITLEFARGDLYKKY